MTSWKPWLPCIHSTVSARRSSPGSRARNARVSRAKRFSACSSSSRSAFVNFSAATAVTRLSSSARTRNASHISSRESVRTRKPRFASNETRPSADRRRNASRTGVRLTAYCAETCSCRNTVPGSSSPETIASSKASAISSAFVPSMPKKVYGRPYHPSVSEQASPIPEGLRPALAELEAYLVGEPPERLSDHVLVLASTWVLGDAGFDLERYYREAKEFHDVTPEHDRVLTSFPESMGYYLSLRLTMDEAG